MSHPQKKNKGSPSTVTRAWFCVVGCALCVLWFNIHNLSSSDLFHSSSNGRPDDAVEPGDVPSVREDWPELPAVPVRTTMVTNVTTTANESTRNQLERQATPDKVKVKVKVKAKEEQAAKAAAAAATIHQTTESRGFAACVLTKDDDSLWPEWLAYHYQTLPLRRLIVALDPYSETKPTKLFERYQKKHGLPLNATVWENDEFILYEEQREYLTNKSEDLHQQHKKRQRWFLQACLRQLHAENYTWVLLVDTDEMLIPRQDLALSGRTALETLTTDKQKTFSVQADSNWVESIDKGCFIMPRYRFVSNETTPTPTTYYYWPSKNKNDERTINNNPPSSFRFKTLEQKYYYFQKPLKTMVDVSKLDSRQAKFVFTTTRINNAVSVHHGINMLCKSLVPKDKSHSTGRPYTVHHYSLTREELLFARRKDPRDGPGRTYKLKIEEEKRKTEWNHTSHPFAKLWIERFVENVSEDVAIDLLRPPLQEKGQLLVPSSSSSPPSSLGGPVHSNPSVGRPEATIVVQLRGEMGNQLSVLSHGQSLQWQLRDDYGISSKLVLRHQNAIKWHRAARHVQNCFPYWRGYNFSEGNTKEFDLLRKAQTEWLDHFEVTTDQDLKTNFSRVDGTRIGRSQWVQSSDIAAGLSAFADLWRANSTRSYYEGNDLLGYNDNDNNNRSAATANIRELSRRTNISFPFLYVQALSNNYGLDRYYKKHLEMSALDETACCKLIPHPEETVFHFRNFAGEAAELARKGFRELTSNQTALSLLGYLSPKDRVAITTRIHDHRVAAYVAALQRRGLEVRVISNQSGVEDFCFLKKARKGLAGNIVSTFTKWAALFGDSERADLYMLEDGGLRKAMKNEQNVSAKDVLFYNFSNPILKERLHYLEYYL